MSKAATWSGLMLYTGFFGANTAESNMRSKVETLLITVYLLCPIATLTDANLYFGGWTLTGPNATLPSSHTSATPPRVKG